MNTLFQLALGNALLATVLALLAAAIARVCRRPALVHSLWILVLLKLLTPSLVQCRIPWLEVREWLAVHSNLAPTQKGLEHFAHVSSGAHQPEAPAKDTPQPSLASQAGGHRYTGSSSALAGTAPESGSPGEVISTPDVAEATPPLDSAIPPLAQPTSDPLSAQFASLPWIALLSGIWLFGSATWFSVVAYRIVRFHRLLRCARPASEELREQAQQLAKRLGLAACPALAFVPGRVSPMVWALGTRPRLLVPSALWECLDEEQQATLLVHELAHLRRRDQWVRGLELIVTTIYWWHPVVWWACREIREAEEQCCDAWVVWSLPRAARAYATALLATIDFLSETETALPAAASGIGHVHDLRRRLTMIMHGTTPRALSGPGLALVLGLGAMLLPLLPTWAQGQAPDPRPRPEARPAEPPGPVAEDPFRTADEDQVRAERADRTGSELSAARREANELKREVERMRQELDRATRRLDAAQRRLATLQDRADRKRRTPEGERFRPPPPPTPQSLPPSPRRARNRDSEQRLSALERRLDDLLQEVQSLRRDISRGIGEPGPGGPGALPRARRGRERGTTPGYPPGPGVGIPATTPGYSPVPPGLLELPPVPRAPRAAPAVPAAPAPPAAGVAPVPPVGAPAATAAPAAAPPESPRSR